MREKYPVGTILKRNVQKRYHHATVHGYAKKKVQLSFLGWGCDDNSLYEWNPSSLDREFTIVSYRHSLPEELFTL
jgi:hypothetical protein